MEKIIQEKLKFALIKVPCLLIPIYDASLAATAFNFHDAVLQITSI